MAEKSKKPLAGRISKGMIIKGQGTVPYNGPKVVPSLDSPNVVVEKGTKRGTGAALRDKSFIYC